MDNPIPPKVCNCAAKQAAAPPPLLVTTGKTAKSIPSVLLSVVIAFFPKCPLCWAIYMSMFGSMDLARLPYMKWLLPVLIAFLAIHLFFLYRRIRIAGYLPFFMSVAGAAIIISCRMFFPFIEWPLITGITCIITGSLLNSFPNLGLYFNHKKITT